MNFGDLDAFVAVARSRNFRRVAFAQRATVSSLSQMPCDPEERFGVRLMNRTTRRVGLADAGEFLLAWARVIWSGRVWI
jgi:DNA-binding transcriptional LysR family regulator